MSHNRHGTRFLVRYATVDWLGGPIRICTYGYRDKSNICMVWAPWSYLWSPARQRAVDLDLERRAVEQKRG